MNNKLSIKENWEKGLTLSKEEINHVKGGTGQSVWTRPNIAEEAKK